MSATASRAVSVLGLTLLVLELGACVKKVDPVAPDPDSVEARSCPSPTANTDVTR